jgi:UDP-glucose 4-epimerase
MGRGIVRDFISKLQTQSATLHVLGDGRQRKSYVLVDDVLAGMTWIADHARREHPIEIFNIAAGGSLDVEGVAAAVARAMGIAVPSIVADQARSLSWAGDQPVIELSIDRARQTGWVPTVDAATAVEISARRMLHESTQTAQAQR